MDLMPLWLNFDDSLRMQPDLRSTLEHVADYRDLGQALRLCGRRSQRAALTDELVRLRTTLPARWLSFIGSGDFHHVTLSLVESLQAVNLRELTLLLIDNHPDWFAEPPAFHCGNWVRSLIGRVREVVIVGVNSSDLNSFRWLTAPLQALSRRQVSLYPLERSRARAIGRWVTQPDAPCLMTCRPWGTQVQFRALRAAFGTTWWSSLPQVLEGRNVYISIDKDVLSSTWARTDWDQGDMQLPELTSFLDEIRQRCTVIGADVCGERAIEPLSGLAKRIDAGRLWTRHEVRSSDHERNQTANLEVCRALTTPVACA